MTPHLIAVVNGNVIGHVARNDAGRVSFSYADAWRHRPDAIPLSLSMPLARAHHDHAVVDPFLWGLLPDNENVLSRWASRFHDWHLFTTLAARFPTPR